MSIENASQSSTESETVPSSPSKRHKMDDELNLPLVTVSTTSTKMDIDEPGSLTGGPSSLESGFTTTTPAKPADMQVADVSMEEVVSEVTPSEPTIVNLSANSSPTSAAAKDVSLPVSLSTNQASSNSDLPTTVSSSLAVEPQETASNQSVSCMSTTHEADASIADEHCKKGSITLPTTDQNSSATSSTSATKVLRSAPIISAVVAPKGLPLLRSRPVVPATDEQCLKDVMDSSKHVLLPGKGVLAGGVSRAKREKKNRNVSWASDSSLVDVQFIDTRVSLVESWDPDCEITLPFAPGTLRMIKTKALLKRNEGNTSVAHAMDDLNGDSEWEANESKVTSVSSCISDQEASLPIPSSFEEARKREHDMEQERAREARELLKSRLDLMSSKVKWTVPNRVVLPAECRIDEGSKTNYNLITSHNVAGGLDYTQGHEDPVLSFNEAHSPASPPRETWNWTDDHKMSDLDVHLFPLSDSTDEDVGDGHGIDRQECNGFWHTESIKDYSIRGSTDSNEILDSRKLIGMNGQADVLRQPTCNEGQSGHQGAEVAVGGLKSNVDYRTMKQSGRERGKLALAPNVRQLLSALQSSGILNGIKMNEVLRRSEGRSEADSQNNASMQTGSENTSVGDIGRSYNLGNEDMGQNRQLCVDGMNENAAMNIGQMMGNGRNGSETRQGLSRTIGLPSFSHPMQGMLECLPFGMPPVPPNAMGLPPPGLVQMGIGLGIPMVGMPMMPMVPGGPLPMSGPGVNIGGAGVVSGDGIGLSGIGGNVGNIPNLQPGVTSSGIGNVSGSSGTTSGRGGKSGRNGRHVETITRPKSKGSKLRKKCKYFGTKQGCRDGDSCMFSHN